jgi:Protein of unknown function (DUF2505)
MKKIILRDAFPVDAERFWRDVFFSHAFQERMYREALGAASVEFLGESGDAKSGIARRLRFSQPVDAPAPVRKLFGETTSMEEDGRFDPATQRWRFRMIPDKMADKIDISGETWLEAKDGGVERVTELSVGVKIFAVGGLVEQYIASSTAASNAKQAAFTRKYIGELAPG